MHLRTALGFVAAAVMAAGAVSCSHKLESAKPTPGAVEPKIVCSEQLTKTLTLAGDKFSPTVFDALTEGQRVILPKIELTRQLALDGSATSGSPVQIPDDPENPAASRVKWQSQMQMTFEVFPELMLVPGVYSITVTNASGETATVSNAMTVVPPPEIDTVVPDIVCTEQYENTVTVNGRYFLQLGSTLPTVSIGANTYTPTEMLDCTAVPGPVTAQLCNGLRVRLAQGDLDSLAPETTNPSEVVVTNPSPAECRNMQAEPKLLTVFPRPRVSQIAPDLVCTEQGTNGMTISGTDFLTVGGVVPSVRIGAQTYTPTTADCTSLTGFDETVERCRTLQVTVAQNDLAPGLHRVEVTNPSPVQCLSTDAVDLRVVPRPAITAVDPLIVCRAQLTNSVKVTGTGFLVVDGTKPTVTIGSETFSGDAVTATAASCTDITGLREAVQTCTELIVAVPPDVLAAGANPVVVRNPDPAGCQSTDAFSLFAVDRPMVSGISRPALCLAQGPQPLVIEGSGFLKIGSSVPNVTIAMVSGASMDFTPTPLSCTPVAGVPGVEVCTQLEITVAMNAIPPGTYTITVTNPSPAACVSTDSVMVQITEPPTISGVAVMGVDPPRICETGGSVIVTGTGFQQGAISNLTLNATSVDAFANVVAPDGTTITSSFASGLMSAVDRYTLTVRNPDGCSATVDNAVQVSKGIFTFFVDPPVVYNGINTKITILATGIDPAGSGPVEVRLTDTAGSTITYTGSGIEWGGADTPPRPQRVRVIVPRDTAPGVYSVGLSDGTGCISFLQDALTVTNEIKLALTGVTPPFGFKGQDTALTITAKATGDLGATETNFMPVPRVYLTPSGDATGTATEARFVEFTNETRITAVSPNLSASLTPGDYDIIVVNPAGEVGLLQGLYKVTDLAPPIVDNVNPGTLRTNPNPASASITGSNFRMPSVRFTCRFPGGDPADDVLPTVTVNQAMTTDTLIPATVSMSGLSAGMICVVRVTNGDDGSFFDFSAVGVANPAQGANPLNFVAGPTLVTPRRSPAGGSARVTRTARFVYAVGGDNGAAVGGALGTVEAAPVGLFGDLGNWFELPIKLTEGNPATGVGPTVPTQRTFAGLVRVGRFFFLVGGHNGTDPTSKVLRSQILDPNEAPLMGDPDLAVDTNAAKDEGLPTGLWIYRVSAVLADNQAHNPGGETLASDPQLIRIPQLDFTPVLRICWREPILPAGVQVVSYRVYRTTMANQTPGNERLLAECPGDSGCTAAPLTCYDDVINDPARFKDLNKAPLPLGSTGVWHEVAPLGTARSLVGTGVALLPPAGNGPRASIFAVGGDAGAGPLASYEYYVVDADGNIPGGAAWTPGTSNDLPSARSDLELFVANSINAPQVAAGDTWIYAGGGTGNDTAVHGAQVNLTTGDVGSWTPVSGFIGGGRVGYSAAVSNDFFYIVAGISGNSLSTMQSKAELSTLPALQNWNSSPADGFRARYRSGQAIQSSFWYLFGGSPMDNRSGATNTTDLSVFGGQ